MRPILFDIRLFGIEHKIGAYAFFLCMAFLFAIITGALQLSSMQKNISSKDPLGKRVFSGIFFSIILAVSGLIGARLLHIFLNFSWYQAYPPRFFSFEPTGFSIFGGILLSVILGIGLSRIMKWDLWVLGDALVPVFAGTAILARMGCWLNGCCYGVPTTLPWGVSFSPGSPGFLYQMYIGYKPGADFFQSFDVPKLHPTQLYEIFGILLSFTLSLLICRHLLPLLLSLGTKKRIKTAKEKKPAAPAGTTALIFFMLFTLSRLLIYPFRVLPPTYDGPAYFYPLLYLSLLFIQFCAFIYLLRSSALKERASA